MGYLICSKCKSYYELQPGESAKDFARECDCGGKVRFVENLDIVDPQWKQVAMRKKSTTREILRNRMQSLLSFRRSDIKNRLVRFFNKYFRIFNNYLGKRIHSNQRRIYRTPYGTEGLSQGFINSIMRELNFHNIRWVLVIPVAIAITIILTIIHGIFTLAIFVLWVAVGYLFDDRIVGTKNAVVAGGISFFLGSLLTGSYLYLIPFTLLGVINGAVCGWIGGYLKTIRDRRM